MSRDRGTFCVDRGLFEHPSFADEPFTQREAWLWMIGKAVYRPHRLRVGKALIELKRGQLAASLRFMARRWGWSEPKVRRFLSRLKTDAMIDAAADAGITRITICNYDLYQITSGATDAAADAEATQKRRKQEEKTLPFTYVKGADAPPNLEEPPSKAEDIRARLFQVGLKTLAGMSGLPEGRCRPLLGKWLKSSGDDAKRVLRAIEDARDERVAEPIAWIEAALKARRSNQPPSNSAEFAFARF